MWNAFKKKLDKEDCQDSLFASLLDTYRPGTTKTNHPAILLSNVYTQATDRRGDCVPYTEKTPETQASKLENLCASIMSLYSKDPNKAQCQLLNLIFRSVGCTSAKALSHQVHTLEDMDNDQWTLILTDLVEDMATSGKSAILLAADPKVGSSKSVNAIYSDCVTADQQVTREYRRIYGEFWYVFALASLSSEVSSSEHQHRVSLGTPNRFDAELVRDIILRVTELVSVGQPDIRAAACLAALQMGHAILDRTLHLTAKLGTATRQYEAFTKQKKSGEKAESLKIQIDNLKRTIDELEELVTGPIMNGIFMHRYRDSHPCIRSLCLSSLSKMSIQRQDIFLCDKYLKYFGWLMSDKAECVRYEALGGLLAPLEEADNRELDVTKLWHVTEKFLPRIADCTLDVCVQVQERAMKLLLFMVREGFLDNMDNDNIWNQINLRSIAEDTSDAVRRDSLYFIMEQLEAFDKDEEDVDTSKKSRRSSNKSLGSAIDSNERKAVLHLDAIASWVAHSLCDGDVPIEEIQIELADLIVNSVKNMPEHCHLMTNWGALIRAISDDSVATVGGATASDRVSVAKQRVLVRFLASAALSEVQLVAEPSFLSNGDDRRSPKRTKMGRSTTTPSSHPHETLSVALLKALPELLLKFKGDLEVLDDITTLPRYLRKL
jgi:cohesin complex subunit SA-1/2